MKRNLPRREPLLSILTCFFLSGAAGLIYQVAWSKALGLIFGHTSYAIATVLVRGVTRNPVQWGMRVSQLYWVNTFGALTGTLISGFILLPAFGLRLTAGVAVALNLIAGLLASRIAKEFRSEGEVRGSTSPKI